MRDVEPSVTLKVRDPTANRSPTRTTSHDPEHPTPQPIVSTFGPGAMVDLPTRSVVVGGLEQWDMRATRSDPA